MTKLFWCQDCDGNGWDDEGYICSRCGGMGAVCHRPYRMRLRDVQWSYWDAETYDFLSGSLDCFEVMELCNRSPLENWEAIMVQAIFAATGALEEF